ncbi:MAG TPA: hypothetical protein VFM98_25405, partial [Ramlibacter sp.]|nr:hypothetical protein [Ramlibacter sp.]
MGSAAAIAHAQALEAGGRARVVRHARLKPACAEDAAQLRFAVEDALNTADFGDAGRLVLVRRLRLAALPPRASPAWVARAMEEAWRGLALHAVPALHPSAARTDAVFFASRTEACMAWLAKLADGEAPVEWFWRAALPELNAWPAASEAAAIDRVLEAALRESEPAVVNALQRWTDAPLVALARALPARAQRRLLQVLVSSPVPARSDAVAAPVAAAPAARGMPVSVPLPVQVPAPIPLPLALVARKLVAWAPLDEAPALLLSALWLEPALHRLPSLEEARVVASRATRSAGQALTLPRRPQPAPEPP